MHRFYWLIEGALAGCSLPGGQPRLDVGRNEAEQIEAVEADLSWLQRQGIGSILSLTEETLPVAALQRHRLEALHLPIPDLAAPSPHQFNEALSFIDRGRSRGEGVVVHCLMGQGRTGSILAAYLVRSGADARGAIEHVRSICPGALSSPPQELALSAFSRRRDWVL